MVFREGHEGGVFGIASSGRDSNAGWRQAAWVIPGYPDTYNMAMPDPVWRPTARISHGDETLADIK